MLSTGNVQKPKVVLRNGETMRKGRILFLDREEHIVSSKVEHQRESRVCVQQLRQSASLFDGVVHEFIGKQCH